MGAGRVRIERLLIGVPLEEEERVGVIRIAVGVVLQASRLGARERHELAEHLRHGIALDKQVTVILSQAEGDRPLCGIYFNLSSPYNKKTSAKAKA